MSDTISLKGIDFETQIRMVQDGKLRPETQVKCPLCNGHKQIQKVVDMGTWVSPHAMCPCCIAFGTIKYKDYLSRCREFKVKN